MVRIFITNEGTKLYYIVLVIDLRTKIYIQHLNSLFFYDHFQLTDAEIVILSMRTAFWDIVNATQDILVMDMNAERMVSVAIDKALYRSNDYTVRNPNPNFIQYPNLKNDFEQRGLTLVTRLSIQR